MKQTWDKFDTEFRNFKNELETLLEMIPISEKFRKQTARINKSWNKLKMVGNEMDQFIAPVKSIKVASTLLNDSDFKTTWKFWKDYLHEQHGIIMRSRAELMSLKRLMDISNEKPIIAISYLEFAMSGLYKNFFEVNEKEAAASAGEPGQKLTIAIPAQYAPKTEISQKVKQKTLQEEIADFKKSRRKNKY